MLPNPIDASLPAPAERPPQITIPNALHKGKPFVAHRVDNLHRRMLPGSGNRQRPNFPVYGRANRRL
jgi:hypothetical protein